MDLLDNKKLCLLSAWLRANPVLAAKEGAVMPRHDGKGIEALLRLGWKDKYHQHWCNVIYECTLNCKFGGTK